MNVKGGVAYIDFKGTNVVQVGSNVVAGVFNNIKKAYNSRKLVIIHNATTGSTGLNDITPLAIRQRNENTFVFVVYTSNTNSAGINSRYVTVSSDDNITVASY